MGSGSSCESISKSEERQLVDYISNDEYAELLNSFQDNILQRKMDDYESRVFPFVLGELIRRAEFQDRIQNMGDADLRLAYANKLRVAKTPMERAVILSQYQDATKPNMIKIVEKCKFKVPTDEFYQLFTRRCKELKDPNYIFQYLSGSEAILQTESDVLRLQLEDESTIAEYVTKRRAELEGFQKLTVRIIFSSLDTSKASGLKIWAASKFTPFGLNHVGLQIGPYYVHWHNGNLVTMHPIGAEKARAVSAIYPVYPSENSLVLKQDLFKLAELMVKYNTEKSYAVRTTDCHCFVEEALAVLNVRRKWVKDGPIHQLYTSIRQSQANNTSVSLKDPAGITHTITNLREMNAFLDRVRPQLESLDKERRAEYEDCMKCVLRAFQLHGSTFETNEANSNRLIKILSSTSREGTSKSAEDAWLQVFQGNVFTEGQ